MENPTNLKEILQQGLAEVARLPVMNDSILTNGKVDETKLENLAGYTIPLISHDYSAKTPIMWNTLYERLGLNMRSIMLVADPNNAEIITSALKTDPRYLGGGFGVGWKEKLEYLDEIKPSDLASVNIVVNENGKLIGYNTDAPGFIRSLEEKFTEVGKDIKGSNIIIFGSGGVAKQLSRLIAEKQPRKISILNRRYSKAVAIANELNERYGQIAVGDGEEMIRGKLLNTAPKPDAAINLSDKGSDGPLGDYSFFHMADTKSEHGLDNNLSRSKTIARNLYSINPNIIIADIVLPKNPPSVTLRLAKEAELENLIDGRPMVVYQAAPAYVKVQEANPNLHTTKVDEKKALEVFKQAAGLE